jgi:hypothetical protein
MRAELADYGAGGLPHNQRIGPCCVPCEVMPETLLVLYGWGCELYSNLVSGKQPEVNPGMARYLSQYAWYLSHRAEKDLKYAHQSGGRWKEAIAESLDWYRRRGRV